MSDISTIGAPRRTREMRPNIKLPDGEVLVPRAIFARDNLGVCDKSLSTLGFADHLRRRRRLCGA